VPSPRALAAAHRQCRMRDEADGTTTAARGIKFSGCNPGRVRRVHVILSGELVPSDAAVARCVAVLDPKWLEELGLIGSTLDRQEAMGKGRGAGGASSAHALWPSGLSGRRVNYGPIDRGAVARYLHPRRAG